MSNKVGMRGFGQSGQGQAQPGPQINAGGFGQPMSITPPPPAPSLNGQPVPPGGNQIGALMQSLMQGWRR